VAGGDFAVPGINLRTIRYNQGLEPLACWAPGKAGAAGGAGRAVVYTANEAPLTQDAAGEAPAGGAAV
jgi:hypothetical protein